MSASDEEMQKQAALDDLRGQFILAGARQALADSGHQKAAGRPEMVSKAIEGLHAVQQKEAARLQPVVDRSDLDGLDLLASFAPEPDDDE